MSCRTGIEVASTLRCEMITATLVYASRTSRMPCVQRWRSVTSCSKHARIDQTANTGERTCARVYCASASATRLVASSSLPVALWSRSAEPLPLALLLEKRGVSPPSERTTTLRGLAAADAFRYSACHNARSPPLVCFLPRGLMRAVHGLFCIAYRP